MSRRTPASLPPAPHAVVVEAESGDYSLKSNWQSARVTIRYLLLQALVVAGFLVLWHEVGDRGIVDRFFISSPVDVAAKLIGRFADGSVWGDIIVTLREALLGWVTGSVLGVILGFSLGRLSALNRVFAPMLHLLNTLPRVALAPLFIIWFGIGELSKVVLVFTVIIFIMIFNTYTGVKTVNQDHMLMAKLLGASEWRLTTAIIVPWCLPWIFVGLRLGLAWSLSGAVIGEFIAARAGIGWRIFYDSAVLDNAGVLAGCVLLMAIAVVFFVCISLVEGRVLRWQPQNSE
jgi:NitT/TauT family transport system permease protein